MTVVRPSNEEVYLVALKRIANMDGHNISTTARAIAKQAIASAPETPQPASKEQLYRSVLVDIRHLLRTDPANFDTAVGHLRSVYVAANNVLMENGDGFATPDETPQPALNDRLGVIKQTPRQASIDDIEWLCEEVERLSELFAATKVELAKYERNPASMLPVRFRLADIIDFLELRCVGVDQSADAARWEVIRHFRSQRLPDETPQTASNGRAKSIQDAMDLADRHRTQPNPSRGNYSCHPWWVVVLADEVIRLRATPETPALPLCDGEVRVIYDHGEPSGVRNAGGFLCFFNRVTKWPGQEDRHRKELALRAQHAEVIANALRGAQETGAPHTAEDDFAHWLSYSGKGKRATAEQLREWREAYFAGVEPTLKAGTGQCYLHPESTCPTPCQGGRKCVLEPAKANAQSFEVRNGPAELPCDHCGRGVEEHVGVGMPCPTVTKVGCEHLRSERLGTKSSPDGEPLFEMRKCLDCMNIFRVRLTQNGDEQR